MTPNMATYKLLTINSGNAGTRDTLKLMTDIVKNFKRNPTIRELALALTRNLPQKKWLAEVQAIHRFVRDGVRYVKDIRGVETLQTPIQTLRLGCGDCDDKSILAASLLEAIGHPTRFKAVGQEAGRFSHVYPETKVGGKWLSVECTEPVEVGHQLAGIKSVMINHN